MFFIAKRAFQVAVQALGLIFIFGSLVLAADRPPLVGIAHIAFQVSDLTKAQAFYGGLLGYDDAFRLYKEDGTTSLVYFKVNDRQYIEIFPGLPPEQDDRLSHIALETTNLEGLRVYLAEKGLQVPGKVNTGRDGNLNFTVKDPDGHRVEFVQYQPGSMQMKAKGSYLSAKRLSSRMLHVGVTVADVGAADRFYKDVLGFSEIWRGGTSDDVTSWINMKVPDGTDYVEYMLVTGKVDRKQLGTLQPDERKAFGQKINAAKQQIEAALDSCRKGLESKTLESRLAGEALAASTPAERTRLLRTFAAHFVLAEEGEAYPGTRPVTGLTVAGRRLTLLELEAPIAEVRWAGRAFRRRSLSGARVAPGGASRSSGLRRSAVHSACSTRARMPALSPPPCSPVSRYRCCRNQVCAPACACFPHPMASPICQAAASGWCATRTKVRRWPTR